MSSTTELNDKHYNRMNCLNVLKNAVYKYTLTDISVPAIYHEYWSEDFLVQQLSLQHLNVNARFNNNAPAQLNDST